MKGHQYETKVDLENQLRKKKLYSRLQYFFVCCFYFQMWTMLCMSLIYYFLCFPYFRYNTPIFNSWIIILVIYFLIFFHVYFWFFLFFLILIPIFISTVHSLFSFYLSNLNLWFFLTISLKLLFYSFLFFDNLTMLSLQDKCSSLNIP